jgi:hypothetical protein
MLGRLLAFMYFRSYPPFIFDEPIYSLLIIWFRIPDIRLPVIPVPIYKINYLFTIVMLIIFAELIYKLIDHSIIHFFRLNKKLVNYAVHVLIFLCGKIIEAFLSYRKQADFGTPIRAELQGL